MSKISQLPWRLAGLFHPEWALRLGTAEAVELRETSEQGLVLEGQVVSRLGPFGPDGDQVASLARSDLTAGAVESARIQRLESCRGAGSRWKDVQIEQMVLCDLDGAQLHGVGIGRAVGCSLRQARLEDCTLREAVLVDLGDARLERVRLGRVSTVDLSGARLVACDLDGADLRGAVLRRATFVDCDPSAAMVSGADFAGARGLDRETRRALLRAGARFRSAGWYAVLRRLAPGADALRLERIALGLQLGALLLCALLCAFALFQVLRPRGVEPVPEPPPALAREATAWEIQTTKEQLGTLREALQRSHDTMVANGASEGSWPSITDFQQNGFDIDGNGPGETREELVRAGLPDNLLTDSVGGVLPYCNDVPTQETITGVDTDWHYCELSGRVFASAGYTELPTLEW